MLQRQLAEVQVVQKTVLVQVHRFSFLFEWMTSVERAGQTSVQPCLQDHASLDADVAAKKALVIICDA